MIRFACHCGHQFLLDDSEAAGAVQCPNCGKLNDVPTHHDLQHMGEDGSLELKPLEIEEEPQRLALLSQIYARGRQDELGNDIDFRPTPEEVAARGVPAAREPERIIRPRYDPETGQLIRPIDVISEPPRAPVPLKGPMLGQTPRRAPQPDPTGWRGPLGVLVMPANLVTIGFVMIATIVANLGMLSAMTVYKLGFIEALVIELFIIGHYANVVEEIGAERREEMPRMLRDAEFYGDIWVPTVNMFGSMMLCYALTVVVLGTMGFTLAAWIIGGVLAAVGTWFFPALLLTLTSSGSAANLRPDRVFGVIRGCGVDYIPAMLLWTIGGGLYVSNTVVYMKLMTATEQPSLSVSGWVLFILSLLLWRLLTVPLLHLFAVQLGLLYRRHYEKFTWVHQRHQRVAV
jgi:hypothetical protein